MPLREVVCVDCRLDYRTWLSGHKIFINNYMLVYADMFVYVEVDRCQSKGNVFGRYQENSHPKNVHFENSTQSTPQPRESHKIPIWNIPTHIFKYSHTGFFSFLFFHHWYYLKNCFVILYLNSVEVRLVTVYRSNLYLAGQNDYILKKVLLGKYDNRSLQKWK